MRWSQAIQLVPHSVFVFFFIYLKVDQDQYQTSRGYFDQGYRDFSLYGYFA